MKPINARVRAGEDLDTFSRWYRKRLNALLHLDVGPYDFKEFRGAMDRTYALALQTSKKLSVPDRGFGASQDTRPISLIRRDIQSRKSNSPAGTSSIPIGTTSHKRARSPRALRTAHLGSGASSQSSKLTVGATTSSETTPVGGFHAQIRIAQTFVSVTGGRTCHLLCPNLALGAITFD